MKGKVDKYENVSFYNDKKGKYTSYIDNKLKKLKNVDEIEDYKAASITGKYIVDMVSGKCSVCEIEYSISKNAVIWLCPICGNIFRFNSMSDDKIKDILIDVYNEISQSDYIDSKNNRVRKLKKYS